MSDFSSVNVIIKKCPVCGSLISQMVDSYWQRCNGRDHFTIEYAVDFSKILYMRIVINDIIFGLYFDYCQITPGIMYIWDQSILIYRGKLIKPDMNNLI
jgi:hypothetical protein